LINAFHPDYLKTHEPDFMKSFRTSEANQRAANTLAKHVAKKREVNPTYGYVHGVSKIPLDMRTFHVYSRAGVK
jgi:hypothetical protein